MSKEIRIYRAPDGAAPFEEWLEALKDLAGRAKIKVRIKRAARGNFGDYRSAGSGIIELRVHFGPGYRVYIGLQGEDIVVLLCGGDKSSQERDIGKAHDYWADYKRRL